MHVSSPAPDCYRLTVVLLLMAFMLPDQAGTAAPVEPVQNCDAGDKHCTFPSDLLLEEAGAVVGSIIFVRQNVFDISQPSENNALYRLANSLHVITRETVIRSQLLFREGDSYSRRLLDESERLLRKNDYIYDAKISPVRHADGSVDIVVSTRDVWTLSLEVSLSRTGGENKSRIGMSEENLLGRGMAVAVSFEDNVDRESTRLAFADSNLFNSWTSLNLVLHDSSDGDSQRLRIQRPFFALNTPWAAGGSLFNDDREERIYDLGDPIAGYRKETNYHVLFGGLSAGLRNGWVRRWTTGLIYNVAAFSPIVDSTIPDLIPEDRHLIYPFIGFELLEDNYQTSANRDQIQRTEDFYFGTRFTASLGLASKKFDSDRDALIYSASASKGFGSMKNNALLLTSTLNGRMQGGSAENSLFHLDARYYRQQSKKRLFYAAMYGTWGRDLDLDNHLELGGDSGLRGYPLRYQTGDKRFLVSLEERYFTDWYPFRLFRVGFAVFADAGRTWGDNPAAGAPLGWLRDVGIGLRIAPTRASGREIYHIDLAFPLDGDSTIDNVQFLIQSKSNF